MSILAESADAPTGVSGLSDLARMYPPSISAIPMTAVPAGVIGAFAPEIGIVGTVMLVWRIGWGLKHSHWKDPAAFGTTLLFGSVLLLGLFDHYFWTMPAMLIMAGAIFGLHIREQLDN